MRRPAPIAAILFAACSALPAQMLVTEEEAAASRAAREPPAMRVLRVPGAPSIEVLALDLAAPVPTPIRVRFEPSSPATIRPESFRVRHGTLRLDITGRITAASQVTALGIDVAEATLPKGPHRQFVEVQDSMGRTSERVLPFAVR
jgi:hypothetical protein